MAATARFRLGPAVLGHEGLRSYPEPAVYLPVISTDRMTIFDRFNLPVYQVTKSTDFASMTKDEWDAYWPRVLDVIPERILPGVSIPEVRLEIEKCMGMARAA